MSSINPKKKRLLFCNTGMLDFPNGAFRRSYSLATELAKQGMEVTFLTTLPVRRERMGLQRSEEREECKELEGSIAATGSIFGKGVITGMRSLFPYYRERRDGMNVVAVPGIMPMKIRKFGYDPLAVFLRWMFAVLNRFDIVHGDGHRPAVMIPAITQRWLFGALYVSEWWDLYGKGGFFDTKRRAWKWTVGWLDNALESFVVRTSDRLIVVSEELRIRAERIRAMRLKGGRMRSGGDRAGWKQFGWSQSAVLQRDILKLWGASDVKGIVYERDSLKHRSEFGLPMNAVILMGSGMSSEELSASRSLFEVMDIINREGGVKDDGSPSVIFVNIDSGTTSTTYQVNFEETSRVDWKTSYIRNGIFKSIPCVRYSEYGRLLSCADAFVLIQHNTLKNRSRWPNCVGDFMAAGRPILGNPIGEIEQFFHEFPHVSMYNSEVNRQWLDSFNNPYIKMDWMDKFREWVFNTMEIHGQDKPVSIDSEMLAKVENRNENKIQHEEWWRDSLGDENDQFFLRDRIRKSSVEGFSWPVRISDLMPLYMPVIRLKE